MNSPSEPNDSPSPDDPPPVIRWRSWPLGEKPLTGSIVLIGLGAAGVGVHWMTGRIHLALLAAAVLAASLWRFFLPVTFELNADGVNQYFFGRHRSIIWKEIRRYELRPAGVLLSPFSDSCPMDAFRGLFLPWGDRRDEVLGQIRYYLDRPKAL